MVANSNVRRIVDAKVGPMPRPMPAGIGDPMPTVQVTYDDGGLEQLFEFYPDEIMFNGAEFVGLTREEAFLLRRDRDVAFLRSNDDEEAIYLARLDYCDACDAAWEDSY